MFNIDVLLLSPICQLVENYLHPCNFSQNNLALRIPTVYSYLELTVEVTLHTCISTEYLANLSNKMYIYFETNINNINLVNKTKQQY